MYAHRFGLLSQARGEDSSGANFVHLYRGRRSISFRRWCFSSRRRFLFRLYLISSERRRLRRLLKWLLRRLLLSHLLSHPYLEGGRGPRGCSFVSKSQDAAPVQSGRPIQTVRLLPLSRSYSYIYTLVSLLSFGRGRSRGWTWNPWREWNPREYPSGHACRRAGAVLPSIVDEPADRSRRVD